MPVIVGGLEGKIRYKTAISVEKAYHGEIGVHGVELKVNLLVDSSFTLVVEQLPYVACHFRSRLGLRS